MRRIALLSLLLVSACDMMATSPATRSGAQPTAKAAPAPAKARPAPAPAAAAPAAKPGQPQIVLSRISGGPGQLVTIKATLQSGGQKIAGTQNDITFDPGSVGVTAGTTDKPDCTPNPALDKEGTAFSYQPAGCKVGACTGIRALVLSLSNTDPIPNGSMLYSCTVQVGPSAKGVQPLSISRVGFSSPSGKAIDGGGTNGSIALP